MILIVSIDAETNDAGYSDGCLFVKRACGHRYTLTAAVCKHRKHAWKVVNKRFLYQRYNKYYNTDKRSLLFAPKRV